MTEGGGRSPGISWSGFPSDLWRRCLCRPKTRSRRPGGRHHPASSNRRCNSDIPLCGRLGRAPTPTGARDPWLSAGAGQRRGRHWPAEPGGSLAATIVTQAPFLCPTGDRAVRVAATPPGIVAQLRRALGGDDLPAARIGAGERLSGKTPLFRRGACYGPCGSGRAAGRDEKDRFSLRAALSEPSGPPRRVHHAESAADPLHRPPGRRRLLRLPGATPRPRLARPPGGRRHGRRRQLQLRGPPLRRPYRHAPGRGPPAVPVARRPAGRVLPLRARRPPDPAPSATNTPPWWSRPRWTTSTST